MKSERTDPVAVRIVDEHGQVGVVRVRADGSAYIRHTLSRDHKIKTEYELNDLRDPNHPLECRRGSHFTTVSVAELHAGVVRYQAGEAPPRIRARRDDVLK